MSVKMARQRTGAGAVIIASIFTLLSEVFVVFMVPVDICSFLVDNGLYYLN